MKHDFSTEFSQGYEYARRIAGNLPDNTLDYVFTTAKHRVSRLGADGYNVGKLVGYADEQRTRKVREKMRFSADSARKGKDQT